MKKKNLLKRKLKGAVTLMDVLIGMALVGILAGMGIPIYNSYFAEAKSKEAELHLSQIFTLEKTFFYKYSKYSNSLTEIKYEPIKLVTEGGKGNYLIQLTDASANRFIATATAVVDFDGDGSINVWQIDQDNNIKEVTPD